MAYYYTTELYHHGVKGMKWGVRRDKRKAARAEKRTKKMEEKFYNNLRRNWSYSYNAAADRMDSEVFPRLNAKYEGKNFGTNYNTKQGKKYLNDIGKEWRSVYSDQLLKDFKAPTSLGKEWTNKAPFMDMYDDIAGKIR